MRFYVPFLLSIVPASSVSLLILGLFRCHFLLFIEFVEPFFGVRCMRNFKLDGQLHEIIQMKINKTCEFELTSLVNYIPIYEKKIQI